jgi:surface polysaccharide O-acyltransferase-like enzyme
VLGGVVNYAKKLSKFYLRFLFYLAIFIVITICVNKYPSYDGTEPWTPYRILVNLGGRDWWYIKAYLILLLLIPFMNEAFKHLNPNYVVIATLGLFCCLSIWNPNSYLINPFVNPIDLIQLSCYYIFGVWLKINVKHNKLKLKWYLIFIFVIVLLMIINLGSYHLPYNTNYDFIYNLYRYESINILIVAILILICFARIREFHSFLINFISGSTLCIYLFHSIFQNIYLVFIAVHFHMLPNTVEYILVQWFFITIMTIPISLALSWPITYSIDYLVDKLSRFKFS